MLYNNHFKAPETIASLNSAHKKLRMMYGLKGHQRRQHIICHHVLFQLLMKDLCACIKFCCVGSFILSSYIPLYFICAAHAIVLFGVCLSQHRMPIVRIAFRFRLFLSALRSYGAHSSTLMNVEPQNIELSAHYNSVAKR